MRRRHRRTLLHHCARMIWRAACAFGSARGTTWASSVRGAPRSTSRPRPEGRRARRARPDRHDDGAHAGLRVDSRRQRELVPALDKRLDRCSFPTVGQCGTGGLCRVRTDLSVPDRLECPRCGELVGTGVELGCVRFLEQPTWLPGARLIRSKAGVAGGSDPVPEPPRRRLPSRRRLDRLHRNCPGGLVWNDE